ncbi:hypothetical protein [Vibrio parahaemolyticus]|uniref:hypothetical protein n=1 Tax=Vibrio parahaemolyticus TaxID=670 RepID=UPI000C9A8A2A|nr:hypothetical protein [Vibrio parahaemolyticus]PMS91917.1 hypothetical protein C1T06_22745 [Vibrio parahaemolyticus]
MNKFELKAVVKISKIEEVLHSQTRDRYALLLDDSTRVDFGDDFQCKYDPKKGDLLIRFDIPDEIKKDFVNSDQENEYCHMVMKKGDFNKFTINDHYDKDSSQATGASHAVTLDSVKEDAAPAQQQKSKYPLELDGGRLVYPAVLHTYNDKGELLDIYPVTSEVSVALIESCVTISEPERSVLAACFKKGYLTNLDVPSDRIDQLLEKGLIEDFSASNLRHYKLTDKGCVAV